MAGCSTVLCWSRLMRRWHQVEVVQRNSLGGKVLLKQEKAVIATLPTRGRFCFIFALIATNLQKLLLSFEL